MQTYGTTLSLFLRACIGGKLVLTTYVSTYSTYDTTYQYPLFAIASQHVIRTTVCVHMNWHGSSCTLARVYSVVLSVSYDFGPFLQ